MKNILKPLAKSASIPLGLIAAALSADTQIPKKYIGLGKRTINNIK